MNLKKKTLKFQPVVKDFEILYQKARYIVLVGGRGSGKSHAAAEALIYYALKYPGLRILCVRSVQRSLAESAYRLLALKMEKLGVDHLFHRTKEGFIHKRTRSTFIFVGISSKPEKVKSMEGVHICWVEEAQTVTHAELELLLPTVRAPGSFFIFTMNRRFPTDAVPETFLERTPPPGTLIAQVNYDQNPLCPKELVTEAEAMKVADPTSYEHIWKGRYRERGSKKLFPLSLINEAMGRPTEIDTSLPIVAGLDVAREGSDHSWLVAIQGLRVVLMLKWQEPDSMLLAQYVAGAVLEHGIEHLNVDAVGLGGPVGDALRHQVGHICHVYDYKSNHTPLPKYATYCTNRRAQSYKLALEYLKVCHIPQHDPLSHELKNDLINIEYDHDTNSRILIVPKKKMKAMGLPSPDASDALAMAVDQPREGGMRELDAFKRKPASASPLAPPPAPSVRTYKKPIRKPRPDAAV